MSEARLFVCATPIGNLDDVSSRLAETLRSVDVVYAEDTRRTAKLLSHLGVTPRVRSLFVGNEKTRTDQLLANLKEGESVALVTDAGMPGVSDPGSVAVSAAHEAGFEVSVIPGPSAVTSALAVSGFGGGRFVFEGFLPRKGVERETRLETIADEQRPVVLFVAPHRASSDLADLRDAAGEHRKVCVARELTKVHEEIWIGTLGDAAERWANEARGEFTVVVEPAEPEAPSVERAVHMARERVAAGVSLSDAAKQASQETGVRRRVVYETLLADQEVS